MKALEKDNTWELMDLLREKKLVDYKPKSGYSQSSICLMDLGEV